MQDPLTLSVPVGDLRNVDHRRIVTVAALLNELINSFIHLGDRLILILREWSHTNNPVASGRGYLLICY
jgi:hypothetical protein